MPLAQDAQAPQAPEGLPTDAELLGHGLGFKPGVGSSGHHGGGWGQRLPIWHQGLWATITTLATTSPTTRSTEGATKYEAGQDREALADGGIDTPLARASGDRDRAALHALELAGKGMGLLRRNEAQLLDRNTAATDVLDAAGHGTALDCTRCIAMHGEQTDFAMVHRPHSLDPSTRAAMATTIDKITGTDLGIRENGRGQWQALESR